MTATISPDWITLSLEAINGVIGVVDKGMLTEAERTARWEVKRIKRLAKANLKADKLTRRRILLRIDSTLIGLDISVKYGLDSDKLKANLKKLCEMLGELKIEPSNNP